MRITPEKFWEALLYSGLVTAKWLAASADNRQKARKAAEYLEYSSATVECVFIESDDEIKHWVDDQPRLLQLKLYKYLFTLGIRIHSIDSEIRKEEKK